MKKIIMLLIISFLLTGCSTEVNLKINNEKVHEEIKIYDLKNNVYINNIIREDVQSNLEAFEREYEFYTINEFEENGYVGKIYEYNDEPTLWWEISHLRACYEDFNFKKTNTHISLNTSDEYRCGYLFGANNVKLVVESDLNLVSSNADKVEGNKLIWNINEDNYKNKRIQFSYKIADEDSIINKNETKIEESRNDFIKYILISLGIISLIIGGIIFIKVKNSNK